VAGVSDRACVGFWVPLCTGASFIQGCHLTENLSHALHSRCRPQFKMNELEFNKFNKNKE